MGQEVAFHLIANDCELSCTTFSIDFGDGERKESITPCEDEKMEPITHVYNAEGEVTVAVLLNSSRMIETSLTIVPTSHECYRFAVFSADDQGLKPRTFLRPDSGNALYIQALKLRCVRRSVLKIR